MACSDLMPSRRRICRPYSGKPVWISAPPARNRRRRSLRSVPKLVNSASIDSDLVEMRKKAVGLPGPVLLVEHLRQRDRLVEALVGEDAQDHRVLAVIAQPHRSGGAGGLDPLGLVVPLDVAAQRALFGIGAGGLVVRDPVRRK